MIIINKTTQRIRSFHRRGEFLKPGTNDIPDESLTRSERELLAALEKSKAIEIQIEAPPESGKLPLPTEESEPAIVVAPPIKKRRARKKKAVAS